MVVVAAVVAVAVVVEVVMGTGRAPCGARDSPRADGGGATT